MLAHPSAAPHALVSSKMDWGRGIDSFRRQGGQKSGAISAKNMAGRGRLYQVLEIPSPFCLTSLDMWRGFRRRLLSQFPCRKLLLPAPPPYEQTQQRRLSRPSPTQTKAIFVWAFFFAAGPEACSDDSQAQLICFRCCSVQLAVSGPLQM